VGDDELVCARLYTGPLFQKYNSVLRGKKSKSSRQFARWYASCKGNQYTTTLHIINSAISKLSQLTIASTVWRGVSGGVLPREFWQPNEYNVRGGVEWAFLSCTADASVAFSYASTRGAGIVFECQQGMLSRGADLRWLSQYPFEREILFAPLTGLEVSSTRVEGDTLVVSCRLSVNLSDDATDKVVSRRLCMLREMASGMQGDVSQAEAALGGGQVVAASSRSVGVERFNRLMREGPLAADAASYNDDETFYAAIGAMVDLKREIIECVAELPAQQPVVTLHSWRLASSRRVDTLCAWLRSEPAATTLELANCGLQLEAAAAIGSALRANRKLERLVLSHECTLPVQALSGRQPQPSVSMSRRMIGALAGCILSELVAYNTSLTTLDLSHNKLGQRDDAAVIAIANAVHTQVATSAKLTTLILRSNYIGGRGVRALADALTHNQMLRLLDLSSNEIEVADALELGIRISQPQSQCRLTRLRLGGNRIDAAGAAAVTNQLLYSQGQAETLTVAEFG